VKYKAFMSYSHAADGKLAPAVQSALHHFARPWYKLRAIRVFRDKTSLSATPALWPSIESSLKESEYFLLLASPESAQSPWVEREVLWWLENRSTDTMFILLTDGQLVWDKQSKDFDWQQTTALGSYLKQRMENQPLYVDLRQAKTNDTLSVRHSLFRGAILDISAPLQGKDKDQLDGEDVRQHRRTITFLTLALVTITLFAAAAAYQWRVAGKERDTANEFLSQVHVTNGLRLIEVDKNYWGGLAWFTEALKWDKDNPDRKSLHQRRIGAYLRHAPKLVQVIRHEHPVNYVEFSPDGRFIATAIGQPYSSYLNFGEAHVWDVESGQHVLGPLKHDDAVISVSFSPDGAQLITGSDDYTARVWNSKTGELVYPPLENGGTVRRAYFISNGNRILTTGSNTRIWDAKTGKPITDLLSVRDCNTWNIGLSKDEKYVVAAPVAPYSDGWGCDPVSWNIETGAAVRAEQDGGQWSYSAVFNAEGTRVVSTSSNSIAWIWDAKTGKTIGNFMHHGDRVSSAIYSPDGDRILTASWDGTARLWSAYDGEPVSQSGPTRLSKNQIVLQHGEKLLTAVYSPDGLSIVTLGADGSARIWDATSGEPLGPSLPYSVSSYRTESSRIVGTVPGDESVIAFSPEGRRIAVAGWDGIVRIWDLAGRELHTPPFKPGVQRYFGFKGVGRKATHITSDGKQVYVDERHWSMDTGLPLAPLASHKKQELKTPNFGNLSFLANKPEYTSVQKSVDGRYELKAKGNIARVWDIENQQWITRPLQHNEGIGAGAFSADGKWIATSSHDGAIRVWDIKTNQPLTPSLRASAVANSMWFGPDNDYLYTISSDGTAWVWNLSPDDRHLQRLSELTQYLSTSHMDNTGTLMGVEVTSFKDDWLTIKAQYPDDFETDIHAQIAWHQQMAVISENKHNWAGALLHLHWLTEHWPDNWPLFLRRGFVNEKLYRPEDAIKDYSRAIELGSDDWLTWYGRAQAYLQLHQWSEATDDFVKLLDLDAPLEVTRSDAILLSGILDKKELYQRIIRKVSDELDSATQSALVTTWALRDDMSDTINSTLEKAEDWYKGQPIYVAPLYYRAGRYQDALNIQKQYFERHPRKDAPLSRVFMAMTQYRLGQTKEANNNLANVNQWLTRHDKKERPREFYEYKWREILPVLIVYEEATGIMK